MPKFRIDKLRDLFRQMGFTPRHTRVTQLAAAEELLHDLDPAKAYPLDFVVYRITGYRPKKVERDLLAGVALQHDLGLLIEHVSDGLDLHVDAAGGPVLTIEDVAGRLGVATKTIQRWRRRGLAARRFIFPDGKRRVGFLSHSVDRYLAEHPEQAAPPAATLESKERRNLHRLWRQGATLPQMSRQSGLNWRQIYEAIQAERLERIAARKVRFFDDPLYHEPGAAGVIEVLANEAALEDAAETVRVPKDLPPYLAALYRTPLLSAPRERGLFLKLNYHKCRFVELRRGLDAHTPHRALIGVEWHGRQICETRNQIAQANLRLVVSVARKHLRPGLSLMELVSDGNLFLLRAIDGFDVHRGHRFSTFATLALMKGFARSVPAMLSRARRHRSVDLAEPGALLDRRGLRDESRRMDAEQVRWMLAQLEPRQRQALAAHFGLGEGEAATFTELGGRLGISRRAARQIVDVALERLRAGMSGTMRM